MIKQAAFEEIVLRECVENKGSRERMIKQCINDYSEYCDLVLDLYKLEKVNDKYFRQIRDYDENSYNKRKIREEEIIFLRKMFMCYKISIACVDAIKFKKRANNQTNKIYDDNIYRETDKELYMKLMGKLFLDLDKS
ncbi:hypothetical protein R2F61_04265 [Mollicutes bacterium LVI A0078]|nr:hypothetical protein RZE84_04285 [Mollicutes bacterium LVI A0075]WOO91774.1 hypothetical protein R2F61_04265 [Mollicutes bacterium LVI A0078]